VFGQGGGSSTTMKFFAPPLFLSLLGLGICIEPLKIQLCSLVYIYFELGPRFFISIYFDFNAS
jgi:hypothetical protein